MPILVVAERSEDRALLRDLLAEGTDRPVAVELAEGCDEAVRRLAAGAFDAVVLDPGAGDPAGAASVARLSAAAPAVPVVVVTAEDDEHQSAEAIRAGAQDCLVKAQVSGAVLRRALRYAMLRASGPQGAAHARAWAQTHDERRSHRRDRLGLPVHVRGFKGGQGFEERTLTDDVSEGGASFLLAHPVEVGDVLHLGIPIPRRFRHYDLTATSYEVWAEVRHVSDGPDGRIVGVAFRGKERPSAADLPRALPPREADKRVHPRFAAFVPVLLKTLDEHSLQERTTTENLGLGGALVVTALPVASGDTLLVEEIGGSFRARAEVTDVSVGKDAVPRLNLRFLDPASGGAALAVLRRLGVVD